MPQQNEARNSYAWFPRWLKDGSIVWLKPFVQRYEWVVENDSGCPVGLSTIEEFRWVNYPA